jgi:hypothetical protein
MSDGAHGCRQSSVEVDCGSFVELGSTECSVGVAVGGGIGIKKDKESRKFVKIGL